MKRIYLDVCCLSRPFDDQTQDKIRLQAEAVLAILNHVKTGDWRCLGSEMVELEVDQNPDIERRRRLTVLTELASERILVDDVVLARSRALEALGFHAFDAVHLACAEVGRADVFLTTDERLLRRARRFARQLAVRIAEPIGWLQEVSLS